MMHIPLERRVRTWLRQALVPPEFRIEAEASRRTDAILTGDLHAQLTGILDALRGPPDDVGYEMAAQLATAFWRLRKRIDRLSSGAADSGGGPIKRVRTAVQMAEDAMHGLEIEIRDYVGDNFDPGNPPTVIGWHPVEDAVRPIVFQTVEPTVFYRGVLVQRGEIIVGRQEQEGDAA